MRPDTVTVIQKSVNVAISPVTRLFVAMTSIGRAILKPITNPITAFFTSTWKMTLRSLRFAFWHVT